MPFLEHASFQCFPVAGHCCHYGIWSMNFRPRFLPGSRPAHGKRVIPRFYMLTVQISISKNIGMSWELGPKRFEILADLARAIHHRKSETVARKWHADWWGIELGWLARSELGARDWMGGRGLGPARKSEPWDLLDGADWNR